MQHKTRFALWGYGPYGKDCESVLLQCWQDECTVEMVFDKQHAKLNADTGTKRQVFDPDEIHEYYVRGFFDAVAVTIANDQWTREVESILYAKGIPVVSLCPPVQFERPAQLSSYDPNLSLDQKGYSSCTLHNQHLAIMKCRHVPYVFDDRGVINGAYWASYQLSMDMTLRLFQPRVLEPEIVLEGQWCLLARHYNENYWHFTNEALDQLWLLETHGYRGNYILFKRDFVEDLVRLLGIDFNRIIWLEDLDADRSYLIEELVCVVLENMDRRSSAPVVVEMARTLLANLPPSDKRYPKRLFVKRIGTRRLDISEEFLARYGFETIIPEELSAEEQIRHFANADIVMTPHGANSTNSLYMRPGSVFIETYPNSYVNYSCNYTLNIQGVYYLPIVESFFDSGENSTGRYRNYRIDSCLLDMVMRNALKLLDKN